MRSRASWIVGTLAIVGLVLAGTSTFTASSTLPTSQEVGYAQATVTGGTVNDIAYNVNTTNPPDVTGMTVTVDTTGIASGAATPVVQFAFNSDAMSSCTASGTWSPPQSSLQYTCTQTGSPVLATDLSATAISIATQ